jgi:hypothetical protein
MVKRRCGLKHSSLADLPSEIFQILYSHLAVHTQYQNRVFRYEGLMTIWNLASTCSFIFKEFHKFICARAELFFQRNNFSIRLRKRYDKRMFYLDRFSNVNTLKDLHKYMTNIQSNIQSTCECEIYFFLVCTVFARRW